MYNVWYMLKIAEGFKCTCKVVRFKWDILGSI